MTRLAVLASHPVQYYAPLFRKLAERCQLTVFYAHIATPDQQAAAGFGTGFEWDIDLFSGYQHEMLQNVAARPGTDHFFGCDTPEIASRLAAGKFDAVLALGWHLKSMVQGIWAAKRQGLMTMVRGDSHLGTPRSALKRLAKELLYPKLLRVFDRALYVGSHNRAYFEHYGYPETRLFHSPHCVDNSRFAAAATPQARAMLREQLGLGSSDQLVLFAGKLIEFKRPLDAVEGVAGLRAAGQHAHLVVAGAGPLESAVRARASELGVPLHMLGFQNQTAMPAAYAAADLLCLPSTGRETWGLVCNEALACGVPIVVSDAVGCAPDLACDPAIGRAYPAGDIRSLTRAMRDLLSVPPDKAAISRLASRHSLEAACDGIMAAIDGRAGKQLPRGYSL